MNTSLDSLHFSQHVSQILERDTKEIKLPVVPNVQSVSDQELLQMTLTATESVKKEYTSKQSVALEVISKRVEQLVRERESQEEEIAKQILERKELIEMVTSLDNKYESTLTKQRELIERVEEVLKKTQHRQPISAAELKMRSDLEVMRLRTIEFMNNLLVIQGKHVYLGAIMRKEKQHQAIAIKDSGITKDPRIINSQIPNIKLMLENQ